MRTSILTLLAAAWFITSASAAPRHVVFILADDLGYGELGCYGQKKIRTPHIDQLAAEGTRFTHHYSGAPVCAPARCVLLTGKHLGHAEIRGNRQASISLPQFKQGQHPISAEALTLAEVFQKTGHATAAIGKWGLGPVGSTGDPNKQGFDLFFGYNCQAVAHSFFPRFLWRNDQQIEINPKPIPGHLRKPEGEVRMEDYQAQNYSPTLMMAEAEQFIDTHKDKPFFLYLALIEPHVAMQPPLEAVNEYPAEWDKQPYRGQCGYLPHPRPRAGYAAMISDLDRHVGRVMKALEKAGIADETLVIFTSDNGTTHRGGDKANPHIGIGGVDADFFNSTAGLRGFKGSVYEGGLRVPMIARLPGSIKAGTTNDTPSYFADWFPTLCAAFEMDPPAALDGENLWPAMTGNTSATRQKPMLWVYPEYGGQVAVRIGNMKAIRQSLATRKPGEWELYDISADPSETKDIARAHPEVIEQAAKVLSEEMSPNPLFPLKVPGLPQE
ncbi:MAG: arylsulfatase [Akkermansiaceae bacterium]|jgi:arylsulfatase A-like enzyme|nr:arylsulfatase [Akkermansiaceae bacterium]